jgi:hypothetical protein
MKRIAIWIFYAIGAVAIGYLALYAYVGFTGRNFEPGDPIHIFRKPDAPNYSATGDFTSRHSGARSEAERARNPYSRSRLWIPGSR